MGVKTPWAFVSERGHERVTAYGIKRRRDEYGGRPIRERFFSPHKPGLRKPMRHVIRDGTAFFAYMSAADEHAAGPGESLTHRLYKEAVASLVGTKLALNGAPSKEVITISQGEIEKEIIHADGSYFADAYLRFESSGGLGLKWAGEVYVEIHKTHEVPPEKIDDLRALRLPVVEVEVPPFAEYRHSDETTTDHLEEVHRLRVKRILEGPTGYIAGKVLSDRSSAEYLEAQLREANEKLGDFRRSAAATASDLGEAQRRERELSLRLNLVESINTELRGQVDGLTAIERDLSSRLNLVESLNTELRGQVEGLAAVVSDARRRNTDLANALRKKTDALDEVCGQLKTLRMGGMLLLTVTAALALFWFVRT